MKFLTLAMALIFSTHVWAGTETNSGNGGGSVVCRDKDKNIISAELLDLYEGTDQLRLSISRKAQPVETQVRAALSRFAFNQGLRQDLDEAVRLVESKIRFVSRASGLTLTDDMNPVIYRKGENCRLEQVANYGTDDQIAVDPEIYGVFSDTDKAALRLHEAVYLIYRSSKGLHDSTRARRIVIYSFTDKAEPGMLQSLAHFNLLPPAGRNKALVRLTPSSVAPVTMRITSPRRVWVWLYDRDGKNPEAIANGDETGEIVLQYAPSELRFRLLLVRVRSALSEVDTELSLTQGGAVLSGSRMKFEVPVADNQVATVNAVYHLR